jgi:tetratricopeptide (TPR) repeat protein
MSRVRRCLPVFWLLLPLGLYLFMRAQALEPPGAEEIETISKAAGGMARTSAMIEEVKFLRASLILNMVGVWGQSIWLMIWPDPLLLYRPGPTEIEQWMFLALQLALLVTAILQFRASRYAALVALAFFYLALLPASRIVGTDAEGPHLAERYLYFPSAGLAVMLVSGLAYLGRRFGAWLPVLLTLIVLTLLTPLTWKRNGDWANEVLLFESEYRRGDGQGHVLRLLTAAYIRAGEPGRAVEICDQRSFELRSQSKYANHCAIAYTQLGRYDDAERAYLAATRGWEAQSAMFANLAQFYLRQGRWQDAMIQFERAIEEEDIPAVKAYRRGQMLVLLYPRDRQKLLEARSYFAEALRLQPRLTAAQQWLDRLDQVLGPSR